MLQREAVSTLFTAASPVAAAQRELSGAKAGYLHCQLQMGHLQSLLTQVDGWALTASGASEPFKCTLR